MKEVFLRQELREARKQLLQYLIEVGQAVSLGEALSGIVHEINNPLAAILGYAQLALTTTSRQKLDGYLQTIHQQAARCQGIVQKLSSVELRCRRRKEVTDLNGIIEKVVSLFSHELAASRIEVELNLSTNPLPVRVDIRQIEHALVSLMMNAKEAMAETTAGRLSITSRSRRREALLIVSDNGPGIPRDIRKKVFQPFFSTKPQSAGLGLSLSRSAVVASGGDIEIAEKKEAGATFLVRLPLAKRGASGTGGKHIQEQSEPDSPGNGEMLVMDDEKPVASLVSHILRHAGDRADVAFTPAQSTKTIHGKDSGTVLMDIKMPGPDGKALFRRVQRIRRRARQKAVVPTGDVLDNELRRFLCGS